jgi:glycosyltransferase involved in cell wall biosynthesis
VDFFRERNVDPAKLELIPLGVDTELFRPRDGGYEEEKMKYGLANRCTIVFVGRLIRTKGIDILLEAVKLMKERGYAGKIRVLVVGPFSDILSYSTKSAHSLSLLTLAQETEMRRIVTFTGPIDHPSLSKLLASSDIFTLPSRAEALGVALLEAMSCGLPVVGSRVGGIANVIQHGVNGYLVSPNNPSDLAAKLTSLVDAPDLRRKMGAAGRLRAVETYDWRVVARKFAALYQRTGRH